VIALTIFLIKTAVEIFFFTVLFGIIIRVSSLMFKPLDWSECFTIGFAGSFLAILL